MTATTDGWTVTELPAVGRARAFRVSDGRREFVALLGPGPSDALCGCRAGNGSNPCAHLVAARRAAEDEDAEFSRGIPR
jgi:hypothetical protein